MFFPRFLIVIIILILISYKVGLAARSAGSTYVVLTRCAGTVAERSVRRRNRWPTLGFPSAHAPARHPVRHSFRATAGALVGRPLPRRPKIVSPARPAVAADVRRRACPAIASATAEASKWKPRQRRAPRQVIWVLSRITYHLFLCSLSNITYLYITSTFCKAKIFT